MSRNDTRTLHFYYLAEIILFLIIKAAEQVGREPGQGDPGVPGSPLALLRYGAIICNFIMILYLYLRHGCRLRFRENLISLDFALTLTADCFMCIIDRKRILGYLFFTLVETVYMIYMKPTWKSISVRLILYAFMLLLLWRVGMMNADNALAMVNIAQLMVNLFCAWMWYMKKGGWQALFCTGHYRPIVLLIIVFPGTVSINKASALFANKLKYITIYIYASKILSFPHKCEAGTSEPEYNRSKQ